MRGGMWSGRTSRRTQVSLSLRFQPGVRRHRHDCGTSTAQATTSVESTLTTALRQSLPTGRHRGLPLHREFCRFSGGLRQPAYPYANKSKSTDLSPARRATSFQKSVRSVSAAGMSMSRFARGYSISQPFAATKTGTVYGYLLPLTSRHRTLCQHRS